MPIDPKKFKKIVTNHFDNLSEEEFLETLHKSSPYLFDGSLEANQDTWQIFDESSKENQDSCQVFEESSKENQDSCQTIEIKTPLNSSSQVKISPSIECHPPQKKYLWVRAIVMTGGILLVGFMGSFLATINTLKPSNAAQVFTSKDKFQCKVDGDDVTLIVKINTTSRPFIKFVDDFTGYSKINRCQKISNNFTRYTEQSAIYVSTGIKNGRSILCASNNKGECIKDDNGGELLSLRPGASSKIYLQLLIELSRNTLLNSSPIFTQSEDLIHL